MSSIHIRNQLLGSLYCADVYSKTNGDNAPVIIEVCIHLLLSSASASALAALLSASRCSSISIARLSISFFMSRGGVSCNIKPSVSTLLFVSTLPCLQLLLPEELVSTGTLLEGIQSYHRSLQCRTPWVRTSPTYNFQPQSPQVEVRAAWPTAPQRPHHRPLAGDLVPQSQAQTPPLIETRRGELDSGTGPQWAIVEEHQHLHGAGRLLTVD